LRNEECPRVADSAARGACADLAVSDLTGVVDAEVGARCVVGVGWTLREALAVVMVLVGSAGVAAQTVRVCDAVAGLAVGVAGAAGRVSRVRVVEEACSIASGALACQLEHGEACAAGRAPRRVGRVDGLAVGQSGGSADVYP